MFFWFVISALLKCEIISLFGNRLLRAVNAIIVCLIFQYFFFESVKRILKEPELESKSFNSLRLPFLQQILEGWSVTDMTWERPIDGKYKGKKGWRRKQILSLFYVCLFLSGCPFLLSRSTYLHWFLYCWCFTSNKQEHIKHNHTVTISTYIFTLTGQWIGPFT